MSKISATIFNEEIRESAVHEALRWLLASRRQGNHSAKTRTEVSGGGKKPWKQKGTGRARAGSSRSPLWRKGGVIFPPKPRDYSYNLPKKVRQLALRVALSQMNQEEKVCLVDSFQLAEPKTKEGFKFLKANGIIGKTLIIMAAENKDFVRGVKNIAGVIVTLSKNINIFDILKSDWILIEKKAVEQLEERIG
jgi:large subunit ribosomal protein L4